MDEGVLVMKSLRSFMLGAVMITSTSTVATFLNVTISPYLLGSGFNSMSPKSPFAPGPAFVVGCSEHRRIDLLAGHRRSGEKNTHDDAETTKDLPNEVKPLHVLGQNKYVASEMHNYIH